MEAVVPLACRLNGGNGLGLLDVCPPRDEGARRTSACRQTLKSLRGRKPRNAALRFGWATAYGDLTPAGVPEMADMATVKPSATQ